MKKPKSKKRTGLRSMSLLEADQFGPPLRPDPDDRDLDTLFAPGDEFSRAVIEHSPLGIAVRDSMGRLLSVNRAWREIWQIPTEWIDKTMSTELVELKFNQTYEYLGDWLPQVRKIYREGGRLTIPDLRLTKHSSGEVRWISQTFYAILGETGGVERVVILTQDITDRKLADEALHESEDRLLEAQRIAGLGHYALDVKTGSWTCSVELNSIFGIDEDYPRDVEGWLRIVHPDHRELLSSYLEHDVLGQHRLFDKEYKIISLSSGQEKWVHGLGSLKFDDHGNPVEMFGTIQDITDRKRVGKALLESEARLLEAQRIAHVGDWSHDLVTGEYMWSDEAFRIVGRERQEVTREFVSSVVHPDDHHLVLRAMKKAQEGHKYQEMELRIVRPDGEVRCIQNRWVSFYDESGEEIKRVGTHQDITDRKRAEEALRHKNIALREVLDQIQAEKELIRQQVAANIEEAVLPILSRLAETASPFQAKLLDLLNNDLTDIASPFLNTMKHRFTTLTPRETELCRLIRGGMSSKEIAEMLNLSLGTVHKHREMIRRKLGLANEGVNLATFLQSI